MPADARDNYLRIRLNMQICPLCSRPTSAHRRADTLLCKPCYHRPCVSRGELIDLRQFSSREYHGVPYWHSELLAQVAIMEYNIGHRPLRAVPLHVRHLVPQAAADARGDLRPSPPIHQFSSSSSAAPPAAQPSRRRVVSDGEEIFISVPTDRSTVSATSAAATTPVSPARVPPPPTSSLPPTRRVVLVPTTAAASSSSTVPAAVPTTVVDHMISDASRTDRSVTIIASPISVSPPPPPAAPVIDYMISDVSHTDRSVTITSVSTSISPPSPPAVHIRRVIQKLPQHKAPAPLDPALHASSPPSSSSGRHVVSDVSTSKITSLAATVDRPMVPVSPRVDNRTYVAPTTAAGVLAPLPSDDADDSDDDARRDDDDDEPVPLVSDSEDDDVSAAATPATARPAPAPLPPVRGARCENPGKECNCTRCIYARTRATGDSTTCPSIDCKCYGCRSARRPRPPPSPKRRA